MNTLRAVLCVVGLSIAGLAGASHAEPPAASRPDETIANLSRSAGQELAKSIEELNQLREQIAAEKLPLSQELTTLEEKLSQLRREHERMTRLVDEGNLQITTIKGKMKIRQDELVYVGNLLDEYAKTFESKVNVSELQYVGEAVDSAKQAAENTTLSMSERFARQIAFIDVSQKRLFDAIGGMRFPGVGVDMQGTVADGQFAIIGPVALFRANDDAGGAGGKGGTEVTAGLVVPQTGSNRPLIRPLDGKMQAGLASLVETGEGLLPLDPSRGGALKALVQRGNLIHIFKKGGPIMWPLLVASMLALGTVIERLLFLFVERIRRDPRTLDAFFRAVARGDIEEAIRIGKSSKFYVVRALGYALAHKETSLQSAVLYAQAQELNRFRRGIPILDTVITLAPLLGLLGTVTGMMGSFSIIGGELSSPGAITGGIAEALIATAFGLGIAITALLPFNFLNTKMEVARSEIDAAATQLELLVQEQSRRSDSRESVADRASDDAPETDEPAGDESDDDLRLKRRDPAQQRTEIERQIAELQAELDEQEFDLQPLSASSESGKE